MKQDKVYKNHWMADNGKYLNKDDVYTDDIWLGVHDSIGNWREVDIEEAELEMEEGKDNGE